MESIIGYIIIILFVTVSVYVYNSRKNTIRSFVLSEQIYPGIIYRVWIKKEKGSISSIILDLSCKRNIEINELKVELITLKRTINSYSLNTLAQNTTLPKKVDSGENINIEINFDQFKTLLSEGDLPFRTFRFVILTAQGGIFKSHELGFNKKWIIYRPDSGNYN